MSDPAAVVVVTGANGLVGSHVCTALLERGARVRGMVRRFGTAPTGVEEVVGDFADADDARGAVEGADAVVTTVHPMGSDLATQHDVGVVGTTTLARVAAERGVQRLVHLSSTSVYDRSPGRPDVDESSVLVPDGSGDYPVTKRDVDLALAGVDGITRVLARPPCILGPGASSVWNTLRPEALRTDPSGRHAVAQETFGWVHVSDLAGFLADLAVGESTGPAAGECAAVNLAAGSDTWRDYYDVVAAALGVEMRWDDEPAWTGRIVADRARDWGWTPRVDLASALAEVADGLRRPVE